MNNVKIFVKSKKKLETEIQIVKTFIEDIVMEFGIEEFTVLLMNKVRIKYRRNWLNKENIITRDERKSNAS